MLFQRLFCQNALNFPSFQIIKLPVVFMALSIIIALSWTPELKADSFTEGAGSDLQVNLNELLGNREKFLKAMLSSMRATDEAHKDQMVALIARDPGFLRPQIIAMFLNGCSQDVFKINIERLLDEGLLNDEILDFFSSKTREIYEGILQERAFDSSEQEISEEEWMEIAQLLQEKLDDLEQQGEGLLDTKLAQDLSDEDSFGLALMEAMDGRDNDYLMLLIIKGFSYVNRSVLLTLFEYAADKKEEQIMDLLVQIYQDYELDYDLSLKAKSFALAVAQTDKLADQLVSSYFDLQTHGGMPDDARESEAIHRDLTIFLFAFISKEGLPPYSSLDLQVLRDHLQGVLAKSNKPLSGLFIYQSCMAWAENLRKYNLVPSMKTAL